jgi:hypothetical protein
MQEGYDDRMSTAFACTMFLLDVFKVPYSIIDGYLHKHGLK